MVNPTVTISETINKVGITTDENIVVTQETKNNVSISPIAFGGIGEAPDDGNIYGRQSQAWVIIGDDDFYHNSLLGIQGGNGTDENYHLTNSAYSNLYQQDQEILTTSDVTFNTLVSSDTYVAKHNKEISLNGGFGTYYKIASSTEVEEVCDGVFELSWGWAGGTQIGLVRFAVASNDDEPIINILNGSFPSGVSLTINIGYDNSIGSGPREILLIRLVGIMYNPQIKLVSGYGWTLADFVYTPALSAAYTYIGISAKGFNSVNPNGYFYVYDSIDTDLNFYTTGDIEAKELTLTDDVNAVNGVFTGDVSGVGGTFSGDISYVNGEASYQHLTGTLLVGDDEYTTSYSELYPGYLQMMNSSSDCVVVFNNTKDIPYTIGWSRLSDNFVIASNYYIDNNLGINMNADDEIGIGQVGQTGFKLAVLGNSQFTGTLEVTSTINGGTLSGNNSGDQDLSSYVVGPATATDNALARYDAGTGKLIQNSTVRLYDNNKMLTGNVSPMYPETNCPAYFNDYHASSGALSFLYSTNSTSGSIFQVDYLGNLNTTATITAGSNIIAGDINANYFWAEAGYTEIYGDDGDAITDLWNNTGADAAFGLRYRDSMFMIGTDYMVSVETGLNMNQDREFGFGNIPIENYKLATYGKTAMFDDLEVIGSTLGSECLSTADFGASSDWTAAGDWAYTTGDYTFTYSSGTGTLTQAEADIGIALKANTWYYFLPTIGVGATRDTEAYIGTECASVDTYFDVTTSKGVYFKTNSNPGDFVIHTTASTTSGLRLDAVSLKEVTGGDIILNGNLYHSQNQDDKYIVLENIDDVTYQTASATGYFTIKPPQGVTNDTWIEMYFEGDTGEADSRFEFRCRGLATSTGWNMTAGTMPSNEIWEGSVNCPWVANHAGGNNIYFNGSDATLPIELGFFTTNYTDLTFRLKKVIIEPGGAEERALNWRDGWTFTLASGFHFPTGSNGLVRYYWNSANDGAGSGLDADKFGGYAYTNYVYGTGTQAMVTNISDYNDSLDRVFFAYKNNATNCPGTYSVGNPYSAIINIPLAGAGYNYQLGFQSRETELYMRREYGVWQDWKRVLMQDTAYDFSMSANMTANLFITATDDGSYTSIAPYQSGFTMDSSVATNHSEFQYLDWNTFNGYTMCMNKDDNKFRIDLVGQYTGTNFVMDTDGTISIGQEISLESLTVNTPKGYAEMYMYDNSTACVIDTADTYHAVYNTFGNNDATLAPEIDTTYFTRKLGVGYTIASVATYDSGNKIQCTVSAGHALLAGEPVTITGSSVAGYNGTYLVEADGLTATEFVVTVAYSATATASVRRPATLKCLVAGKYQTSFTVSGVAANPNDNFKWELNKDITPLDNITARAIWQSSTKYETAGCQGLCSLTAGQYVWLSVKNYSGTGNLTISSANVKLHRLI